MPAKLPIETMPPEVYLAAFPPPMVEVANRLRAIVQDTLPGVIERVRPGWGLLGYDLPVGRRTVYIAWIWPEPPSDHVHLGFEHGILLEDPAGRLQGRGITKQVRWLTYRPGEPVDAGVAAAFLRDAERHALLPGTVRRAAMRDRHAAESS